MVPPGFDKVLEGKNIDYRRLAELAYTRTEILPRQIAFLGEMPDAILIYIHKKMKANPELPLKVLQLDRPAMEVIGGFTEDAVKEALMTPTVANKMKRGQIT